ncbi:3'-phosphoesterase [Streptomyces sp. Je 1-4]|uniref:DNA polymerase ligase N-terminal domain-containing protein n=1 Tax=Streptomyces TaxID=1883 RepID=UPI00140F36DA|nr:MULTISPECIES: DNA polymerase ligase N-terminal domain-containing protein [unclassified Streptomyces]QIK05334.1 3'-phosphoesterase [Streptomyces sp. ID38640]UYB38534.1 3'-phosphoesterase [Streptomyces sp. Je 1-4]UZQ34496.1 3'-phosphoesterase [Streptomyces sp. Je 1-4] [Streptomyces sp. Je 1-4 4N24]UZQ41914.1 3'-phosphoesterase [Streptomyces sp. Je 1-4] [Streptomyces sp. Je 1-4 4N24_ara]
MGARDGLTAYRGKRHFDRTREPPGAPAAAGDTSSFVVQIHDASTLHFDFRLEVDGVLKSWSVPKGPSADPHDKRLAMPTEDHPLEYREFEGVIPAGEYGAGTVIVWDQGSYRPLPRKKKGRALSFRQALEDGHVSFWLDGSKLHGGYALTRFRTGEGPGKRESWLLVKENDDRAGRRGTPDARRARSVRSGRTLKRVAADEGTGRGGG